MAQDWQLELIKQGNLQRYMNAELAAVRAAVSRVLVEEIRSLRNEARAQVASRFGRRLGNASFYRPSLTDSVDTHPVAGKEGAQQRSLYMAASINSRVPRILRAHEEGATITPRKGRYLAIPLPAIIGQRGRGRFQRTALTPETYKKVFGVEKLVAKRVRGNRFVLIDPTAEGRVSRGRKDPTRGRVGLAFPRRRKPAGAPIFLLVPRVRLPKRLTLRDLEREYQQALGSKVVDALANAPAARFDPGAETEITVSGEGFRSTRRRAA